MTPSAKATSFDNSTVAKVEPSTIVTTKSKALSSASVRWPETFSRSSRAT